MPLSLLLLTLVAAPDDADRMVARAATPLSSPGSWVTTADYPVLALRSGAEGVTGFELAVDTLGRVTGCRIVSSSGSAVLDQATCLLVSQRARFRPASDAQGKYQPGTYNSRVRWVIPIRPGPIAGRMVTSFTVAADGTVTDCKVEERSGGAERMPDNGDFKCTATPRIQPYRDATGTAVPRHVRTTVQIEVDPAN